MALAPAQPGVVATLSARVVYRARSLLRTVRHLALLITCLAVFALSSFQMQSYESAMAITRSSFTLQGAIPVPVLRFTPHQHPVNVVAVIAHGYSADKEMMSGLADDLARQGITVYTFDFPGHGASTVPYGGVTHTGVVTQLVTSLGEVVDYSLAHQAHAQAQALATQPKLVLIGYSLGTIAVGEYALQHPTLANLQATVLVAGILGDQPTTTNPRNLLVLSGQFDLPGINDISRRLIASGCGVPIARVTDTYQCGTVASATHTQAVRERVVLSGLDHISIITAGSTHATILHWLGAVVDSRITDSTVIGDARIHWLLIGFLAATLAALAVLSLCAAALRLSPVDNRTIVSSKDQVRARFSSLRARVALVAGVLIAALLVLRVWLPSDFWAQEPAPFGFLNQQVSADVALFLFVAGAFLLAVLRALPQVWRSIRWPSGSHALREVALACAVVGFLYLTLGRLSSFGWESLALSPARLWRAAVYAVMVWPFFLGVRALFQHQVRRLQRRGALVDLIVTVLVLASLGAAIALNFARLSYLGILLPVVAILLFAFIGLSAWMRRVDDNVLMLASVAQALLLGWLLAATLPLIG